MNNSQDKVVTNRAKQKRCENLAINAIRAALKDLGLEEGAIELLLSDPHGLQDAVRLAVKKLYYEKIFRNPVRLDSGSLSSNTLVVRTGIGEETIVREFGIKMSDTLTKASSPEAHEFLEAFAKAQQEDEEANKNSDVLIDKSIKDGDAFSEKIDTSIKEEIEFNKKMAEFDASNRKFDEGFKKVEEDLDDLGEEMGELEKEVSDHLQQNSINNNQR